MQTNLVTLPLFFKMLFLGIFLFYFDHRKKNFIKKDITNIYTFVLTILYYKKTTQKTFFIPLYKFIYIFLKKHVVLSSRFQRGQQSRSLFIYCFFLVRVVEVKYDLHS